MRMRVRILAFVTTVVVGGGLALWPGTAQAAAGAGSEIPASAVVAPMKRVGVDHAIAHAHGYEVRVDSTGVEYAVKKGTVTPFNEVPGDCGSSFIYFTAVDTSKHYSSVYTGFRLNSGEAGAVFVNWYISIVDNYGASSPAWADPAASVHFWAKVHPFTAGGPTIAYADVLYGSTATLWSGTICFSYGPSDSKQL